MFEKESILFFDIVLQNIGNHRRELKVKINKKYLKKYEKMVVFFHKNAVLLIFQDPSNNYSTLKNVYSTQGNITFSWDTL